MSIRKDVCLLVCLYTPTDTYVASKNGQFASLVYICEFKMQFIL